MDLTRFSPKRFVTGVRRVPFRFRRGIAEYRFYAYFAVLGPGIISASSGNEVSGIATYSTTGAAYGYTLLWTFIPMTIFFLVAQEMCVRMGVVTGQGLADLIREQFGVRWSTIVKLALLLANAGIIIAEFVGIAQASELFGISRYISVPITAIVIWWLVVRGTPKPDNGPVEVDSPFSANLVVSTTPERPLVTATRRVAATNPHFKRRTLGFNPQMEPWYQIGAAMIQR